MSFWHCSFKIFTKKASKQPFKIEKFMQQENVHENRPPLLYGKCPANGWPNPDFFRQKIIICTPREISTLGSAVLEVFGNKLTNK